MAAPASLTLPSTISAFGDGHAGGSGDLADDGCCAGGAAAGGGQLPSHITEFGDFLPSMGGAPMLGGHRSYGQGLGLRSASFENNIVAGALLSCLSTCTRTWWL